MWRTFGLRAPVKLIKSDSILVSIRVVTLDNPGFWKLPLGLQYTVWCIVGNKERNSVIRAKKNGRSLSHEFVNLGNNK